MKILGWACVALMMLGISSCTIQCYNIIHGTVGTIKQGVIQVDKTWNGQ